MDDLLTTDMIIHQLLSQPIDLPVFHDVALRLQGMMQDNSYRIEEVIKLVNEDTALASEMLKHANSTYNIGKEPITTIKNAIIRLGSQEIVNLAFTASLANTQSHNAIINEQLRDLWHHSHAVAIISAWLAVECMHNKLDVHIDADEMYMAGLLHDIGKLYLLKSYDVAVDATLAATKPECVFEAIDRINIPQGIKVMQHWHIPDIYYRSLHRHVADNWMTGNDDHWVAIIRLSCKLHHFTSSVSHSAKDEFMETVKDEIAMLGINDIDYVINMANAIIS